MRLQLRELRSLGRGPVSISSGASKTAPGREGGSLLWNGSSPTPGHERAPGPYARAGVLASYTIVCAGVLVIRADHRSQAASACVGLAGFTVVASLAIGWTCSGGDAALPQKAERTIAPAHLGQRTCPNSETSCQPC